MSGCAKAQANAVPDGPPLAVPAVPPRVIGPVEDEPLAENPPTPEPAATPPRTTARPAPATSPRRPTTTTTTPPPAEEPKPDAAPPPAPAVNAEAPVAAPRPVPAQADPAAERRVRDLMRRATADLGRIHYQGLSVDGKAQYEQSKRFNEQAEQALKERNYMFATTVAEKAAALATELLGR